MADSGRDFLLIGVKAVLTAAFVAAGISKLAGVEMMVATFDAIGWGQGFRALTGIIEVAGAVMLWAPGMQALGAFLLFATMFCAVLFHIFLLGPSAIPAAGLGILAAYVLYRYRAQLSRNTA